MNLLGAVWTPHARLQVAERLLPESAVEAVLRAPELILPVRSGRVVAQGGIEVAGRDYLLRVVVDVDREPHEIVTAYRTSKLQEYEVQP